MRTSTMKLALAALLLLTAISAAANTMWFSYRLSKLVPPRSR